MKVDEGFVQAVSPHEHPYHDDPVLPGLLKRLLPASVRGAVESDLGRLGQDLIHNIRPLSPLVHPATLKQYDQWGRRVDILHTSEGWKRLEEEAIREGYVAIAYERTYKEYSRVYMFAKTMIMTGDFNVIMCPMGMTDGAARTIELFGTEAMKKTLYPRLISRNPQEAYLSGQWMTEKSGGTDVSGTETTAEPVERIDSDLGDPYILNGFKWFSSAAEGNIAVALARTGKVTDGSRGLSLFLVPLRHSPFESPLHNNILIHRLKEKVGTHGVPTAELSLEGTRAWLVGSLNEGVKNIAPVLNITRIHSAIHSIGSLQRCLSIARAYSTVRSVEGGKHLLKDVPLHVESLADINLLYRALTHLTFGAVVLLGKVEYGVATPSEAARLRFITPAIKAYAATRSTGAMEEAMAALGGLGYMEETGIGRLIRDSMVEKIWEGTINALALDLKRAARNEETVKCYLAWAEDMVSRGNSITALTNSCKLLQAILDKLPSVFETNKSNPITPRSTLNIVAVTTAGISLLEHALWAVRNNEPTKDIDVEVCRRWVEEGELSTLMEQFTRLAASPDDRSAANAALVYGAALSAKL